MNTLIEVATAITGVLPNPEPEQPPGCLLYTSDAADE